MSTKNILQLENAIPTTTPGMTLRELRDHIDRCIHRHDVPPGSRVLIQVRQEGGGSVHTLPLMTIAAFEAKTHEGDHLILQTYVDDLPLRRGAYPVKYEDVQNEPPLRRDDPRNVAQSDFAPWPEKW